ncbi:MAG TPA: hypothetical protein VL361_13280 [Candidatus Limnocylindrales bacterium]|jgi:hypothetical protein|nr:hypothetical protein [Candidatus Limnocylindrales bacterium]
MNATTPIALAAFLTLQAQAQNLLFDFENAPAHTSLPITVSTGGLIAQLSATDQGFSIQLANTMGFTPIGFAGNCIYPNSVFAADLLVSFSMSLTDFSILYAPQELACDSSATMRVTAYLDSVLIGTAITNAQAGTWPSEILQFSSAQTFNRVVVHYDKAPVTGGDWGPIFMADNMKATVAPAPVVLEPAFLLNGSFQLTFSARPGAAFEVLATTNLAHTVPYWSVLGIASEISPGAYLFTDPTSTNSLSGFYRVRSL